MVLQLKSLLQEHVPLQDSVSEFVTLMENSRGLEKVFNVVLSGMVTEAVL